MNLRAFLYWTTTALVALPLVMGGLAHFHLDPSMVENMRLMGYSTSFMRLLGFWKILAVPALLIPGAARLKEFAYAGIFFLLTGAAYSHYAAGHGLGGAAPALVILCLAFASYLLRPASRALGGAVLPEAG
jgi:hypothetical protein